MIGGTSAAAGLIAAAPVAVYAGGAVALIAVPVAITNRVFVDPKKKQVVMDEYKRRNMELPKELAPGESVTGSLFFPLTPGPEYLSVIVRVAAVDASLKIPVPELEELHFTYVPDKAALKAAKPKPWPSYLPKKHVAPR